MDAFTVLIVVLTSSVVYAQRGVYMLRNDPVYVSYSTWLVTYTIEVEPYESQIAVLRNEIDAFYDFFIRVTEEFSKQQNFTKDNFAASMHDIRDDIKQLIYRETMYFDSKLDELMNMYNDLRVIATRNRDSNSRTKRGIFPLGGRILSYLFSIPTNSNLRKLKSAITNLRDTQTNLVHVVDKSISILNLTHNQVKENREILISLQNTTMKIQVEMNLLRDEIHSVILPELTYLELMQRLNDMYHVISNSIGKAKESFTTLLTQLEKCIQGDLPMSLISPSDLSSLFRSIDRKLTNDAKLPYDLTLVNIFSYYKFLHPLVIPDKKNIHILLAIPIIPDSSEYTVYEAITLPFMNENLNMAAFYDIEANFIAISEKTRKYTFIQENEINFCREGLICKINSPLYEMGKYPSCIFSLYQRDENKIEQFCNLKLRTTKLLPVVKYLGFGKWVISTPNRMGVNIDCPNSNKTKIIRPGISDIQLENGCSASSELFYIPIYESGEINIEKQYEIDREIRLNSLSPSIWNQSDLFSKTFDKLNSEINKNAKPLSHISDIPFDYHSMLLNSLPSNNKILPNSFDSAPFWIKVLLILLCIIICISIFVILYLLFAHKIYSRINIRNRKRANIAITGSESRSPRTPYENERTVAEETVVFLNDSTEPTVRFERPSR